MATRIKKTDLARDALYEKVNTMVDELNTLVDTKISNCITYIPQDIKLELNNGTITLKAGSKVYVPNGAGVFDSITTTSDIKINPTGGSGKVLISINSTKNLGSASLINKCVSGAGVTPKDYGLAYDTTTNIITRYGASGSIAYSNSSFPLAVCSQTDEKITSIDQVFNGFGYIGSTVFALPGVKGLIPNGRNADGSLKNKEITISSLRIYNVAERNRTDVCIFMSETDILVWGRSGGNVTSFSTRPQTARITYTRAYIEDENVWIHCYDTTTWQQRDSTDNITELFSVDTDANKICGIHSMKSTFHALDYNDKSTISGWSMPSSRYIDLTLGASGSTYIAPANGWLILNKAATGVGQEIRLINQSNQLCGYALSATNNASLDTKIPCRKGERILVYYSASGSLANFRFIYAEGE